MYKSIGKRLLDFFLAAMMAALSSPIVLLTTFVLAIVNRGNPFFFQVRPGYQGRLFLLVKFKTMRDQYDSQGYQLPDHKRITRVGRVVRKTSIDELPQLWNVLKGDMSLVGPRPLLVEYLPLYSASQARRHVVRPGITGWAQVNGRNSLTWREKFDLDVWYVDNFSFALDLRILFMTIKNVLIRKDIDNSSEVPMPKFTGNED
jgi:lipopolysaccharide/colanic/teichoic acid biosynthesis glycosyltransferase